MVVLNKFLFLLIEVLIVLFIIKLNLFIVLESIDNFVFVIVGNGVVEMFFIVGVDVVIVLRVLLRIVVFVVLDIEIWILLDGVDVKILVFDNGGV